MTMAQKENESCKKLFGFVQNWEFKTFIVLNVIFETTLCVSPKILWQLFGCIIQLMIVAAYFQNPYSTF